MKAYATAGVDANEGLHAEFGHDQEAFALVLQTLVDMTWTNSLGCERRVCSVACEM